MNGNQQMPRPQPRNRVLRWWASRSLLLRFLVRLGIYSAFFYANALYLERFFTPIDAWPYWQIQDPNALPGWYLYVDFLMIFMFFDIVFRFLGLVLSFLDRKISIDITFTR